MPHQFSNAEDATPLNDYSGLIPNWVRSQNDLNRIEAENILHAQSTYLKKGSKSAEIWFTPRELKKIHQAMFGNVWEWAGCYRRSITSIGINPPLISQQVSELCSIVNYWITESTPYSFVEMAARIHHRLVYIHPFENGNGRFSRLIADRFLITFDCTHPRWPEGITRNSDERARYIQSLRSADKGDISDLIKLMIDLGAKNPTIFELLQNKTFRRFLNNKRAQEILQAIIESGADPYQKNEQGKTPLDLAIKLKLENVTPYLR